MSTLPTTPPETSDSRRWSLPWAALLPFVAATFLYLLLVAPHSFHLSDDGFILSLSYRISQGDVPYRDFIYVRPAASLFLHTIWLSLPDPLQFIAARASFFLFFGMIPCALLLLTADHCFADRRRLLPAVFLTGVCWIYAMHNFNPMPWHTIDGLFFSSLSLCFLTASFTRPGRSKAAFGILAALFAGLAPLAKQSFAPYLAFFLVAAVLGCRQRTGGSVSLDWRHAGRLVIWSLAPLALLVLYLDYHDALHLALTQIKAASTATGLQAAVIDPYLWGSYRRPIRAYFVYGVILAGIGSIDRRIAGIPLSAVPYGFFVLQILWPLHNFVGQGGINSAYRLFAAAAAYILMRLLVLWISRQLTRELALVACGALVITLSAQISWGYHVPILGFAGVGYALAALTPLPVARRWPVSLQGLLFGLPFALALYLGITLCHERPYRDGPVAQQTHDLHALSDRFLPGMTTGTANFQRLSDLMTVADTIERTHPDRQAVIITDAPLYYYLRHRRNRTALDWWLPEETANQAGRLLTQLRQPDKLVIVRQDYQPSRTDPRDRFVALTKQRGRIVFRHGQFDVYDLSPASGSRPSPP